MKNQRRSSVFLKGFVFVLTGSLAVTYVWMYIQARRNQPEVRSPELDIVEANYEREKATIEGYIARADQALADLDSQRGAQLTEPHLDGCYRIKYGSDDGPTDEGPLQPTVEVSRELDQQCADRAYEMAKSFTLQRQREIADKTSEITSTKQDLEDHLKDIRIQFNADRVRILTQAERARSKDSFITKFPIAFGLMSLLTVAGICFRDILQRRNGF